MYDAICKAEKDRFVRDVLEDHLFTKYIFAKKHEWDDYNRRITNWEVESYLGKY